MRFVALVSGGKDSIYSILECLKNGHELVACVHMARPESVEEESYMYQTAASEVVRTLVEDCLEVPLLFYQRVGTSVNTSLVYDNTSEKDEVEDLYMALKQAKEQFVNVQAVCSGAILSTYQRVRIEHVCNRLGLTSLSYLWRLLPQKELLKRMLEDGIEAVIVRAACPPGLVPRKHLNKTLRFLWDMGLLERLHQRYQFHVCGEGGEYESLVIDSPLHKKKLVFDEVEIDETDDDVGDLRIISCHAHEKGEEDIPLFTRCKPSAEEVTTKAAQPGQASKPGVPTLLHLPHVCQSTGGLMHLSELMASMAASSTDPQISEADLAVTEACEILAILGKTLKANNATAKDVLFVHLYLSEISHFASINAHYQAFFGSLLPPSRSCVAVGKSVLPGGRRVLLDCMVQPGSGEYMRVGDASKASNPYAAAAQITKTSKLREVLHVQSISHWAPVCVGPYSQVNTLRSGIHFMAGQIGLIPATMQLHPTWTQQLDQCWKNVASVFDALEGGSLEDMLSAVIYVSHRVDAEEGSFEKIESISKKNLESNGSIVAGHIDSILDESELFGGYEDQGTWEEMKAEIGEEDKNFNRCPMLIVSIPEMPKGALVEVEVVAATRAAAKNLEVKDASITSDKVTSGGASVGGSSWDTGHQFPVPNAENKSTRVDTSVRVLGHQGAAIALVSAAIRWDSETTDVDTTSLLSEMIQSLRQSLSEARSGLGPSEIIHIRLFHIATKRDSTGQLQVHEDGLSLRSALQKAAATIATSGVSSTTATSVVPVHSISLVNGSLPSTGYETKLAMQVLCLDPVHLETSIWINKDREYSSSLDL